MTQFDPYLEWLGIRPEERPLSYYRLLGISNFESNPDVIERAVKKRAEKLRSLLTGNNQQLGQEVIKNIATAKACLLNVQQKELYDKKLRAALQPGQPAAKPGSELKADLLSDEASKVSSSKWVMVPAVAAVVTVIIVLVVVMQPEEGKQVSTTIPQEPSASSTADSPTSDPADFPTSDLADSPTSDPYDAPTSDPYDAPTSDPDDAPTSDPDDAPTTSSVTPVYTQPVNLIKRAIPPLDERVAAVARWENFFKEEIAAAQGRLDKAALAGKIFQESNGYVLTDPDTHWAELFAVLQFSYIMARDSGSKTQTDIIRERLDEIFSVDVLALRLGECQVWEKSVVQYPTAPHVAGFVNLTGSTSDKGDLLPVLYEEIAVQAEALQRYDIVAKSYEGLVRLQETITGKAPVVGEVNIVDTQLADIITELKGRVATWKTGKARAVVAQQRFFDYQEALELLKQNPQDPAANRDAGVYVAFVRGNWNEGCRYLAKGSDARLKGLAGDEIEHLNPVVPNSVNAMQSLGDGWADYGQREAELVDRQPVYHHASDWYERAKKVATSPLDKGELEKKIAALSKLDVNVEVAAVEVPAVEVPAVEVPAVEVPAVEVPAVEVAADKGTQKIILQAGLLNNEGQVPLPEGVTSDNCSLAIKFVNFPSGTQFNKAGSIVKRGREVIMETTGPSEVKFKIGIVAAKSDEDPAKTKQLTIRLRTTFKKTRLSTVRPQLSMAELQKAIMGQQLAITRASGKIADYEAKKKFWDGQASTFYRNGDQKREAAAKSLALGFQGKINSQMRLRVANSNNIKGWQTLQRDLESIFGAAEIHFKIVPTP